MRFDYPIILNRLITADLNVPQHKQYWVLIAVPFKSDLNVLHVLHVGQVTSDLYIPHVVHVGQVT